MGLGARQGGKEVSWSWALQAELGGTRHTQAPSRTRGREPHRFMASVRRLAVRQTLYILHSISPLSKLVEPFFSFIDKETVEGKETHLGL